MSERYKIIEGSVSFHCCFEYTVVDTQNPVKFNNCCYEHIFECFEKQDADIIVTALNGLSAHQK